MDHLGSTSNVFQVPVVVLEQHRYDNLGFHGFPERMGYDHIEAVKKDGKLSDIWTQETLLSVWQAWLFFGLAIDVFKTGNVQVTAGDFIRVTEDGRAILCTEKLPSFLRQWAVQVWMEAQSIELNSRYLHGKEVAAILREASEAYNYLGIWQFGRKELSVVDAAVVDKWDSTSIKPVFLAIACLGEALTEVLVSAYRGRYSAGWPVCQFLYTKLLDVGWCPYEINRMLYHLGVSNSGAFFLGYIGVRKTQKDHQLCSQFHCQADQINDKLYQTKHTSDNCDCPFGVKDQDVKEVCRLVSKRTVPLFTSATNTEGKFKIKVRPIKKARLWRRKVLYVAISHVWSDGLGNADRMSLPQCQLLRVQELCNRLFAKEHHPVPFWIDTLCVPHDPRLKGIALFEMGAIYEHADKVLVVDSNLLKISINGKLNEKLLQIACSNWSQRLWTFQEGYFARELYYQFLDGTLSHDEIGSLRLLEDSKLFESDLKHLTVQNSAKGKFKNTVANWTKAVKDSKKTDWLDFELGTDILYAIGMRNVFKIHGGARDDESDDHESDVGEIIPSSVILSSLLWRQTSKPADEAVCLAWLLGVFKEFDPSSPSAENPLKEVLIACGKISLTILFGDRPRSQEDGFRWMPTSLLQNSPWGLGVTDDNAEIRDDGLYAVLPVIVFNVEPDLSTRTGHKCVFLRIQNDSQLYTFTFYQDSEIYGDMSRRNIGYPSPEWANFASSRMAFLTAEQTELKCTPLGFSHAVLVTITDKNYHKFRFEAAGILAKARPQFSDLSNHLTLSGEYLNDRICRTIQ